MFSGQLTWHLLDKYTGVLWLFIYIIKSLLTAFSPYCQKSIFRGFVLHPIDKLINWLEIWHVRALWWYACSCIFSSSYFLCFWWYSQKLIFGANLGALFGTWTPPIWKHLLTWNLVCRYITASIVWLYNWLYFLGYILGHIAKNLFCAQRVNCNSSYLLYI